MGDVLAKKLPLENSGAFGGGALRVYAKPVGKPALHQRLAPAPRAKDCRPAPKPLLPSPTMCLAIPGKLETIAGDDPIVRMGRVNFGGVLKDVSLAYLPEIRVGDYVIVHAGFALSKVDEDEAAKIFDYLRQMNELADLQEPPP